MVFTARPLLRATARPMRGLSHQPRHAQQALFSSTRTQQKLPGGTPGETADPTEQKTPLGPYYESMLVDPQPLPKTKPEQPPASSPNAPSKKGDKASATPSKKTSTEAGRLPTDPDPVPAPSSPTQLPPLSATASPAAAAAASNVSSTPSFASSSSSPITFGTKLGGPANEGARAERLRALRLSQGSLIAGIRVPPRPDEPDNCCMSGCVNCVWDRYRDDMEEWAAMSLRAEAALQAQRSQGSSIELGKVSAVKGMPSVRRAGGPEVTAATSADAASMDDDGGGSDTNWVDPLAAVKTAAGGDAKIAKNFWDDELYKNVPIGIREFMKQEKRLKEKHARKKDPAAAR
ncbi:Oxidoreductase-like protein [Microdochium nivale]|nr:Oxidoreductase-like protein [Microdochium nivale]